MKKHVNKFGLLSSIFALAMVSGSVAFAMPPHANVHAQSADNPGYSGINNPGSSHSGASQNSSHKPTTNGQANGQSHMAAGQLKACQNRQNAINNIMGRIDTRAQNQINLFGTIATRVENFYTKQGKTLSNYDQLVSAVNSAQSQAENDFGIMKTSANFNCSNSNPKGMVTSFQSYLKTEISDLKTYRTSVKNLIVGVASANGVTVSGANQSSASQGGQ